MAELGRARPVVVAAIATILTANISILSTNRAQVAEFVAAQPTTTEPLPRAVVVFGKTDTPLTQPTLFAARVDGSGLVPWSQAPTSADSVDESHDGTKRVVAYRGDIWITQRGRAPRQLTHFDPVVATFCGASATVAPVAKHPVWSPEDAYVAFLSNVHHLKTFGATFDVLVVNVNTGQVRTAYRAQGDVCEGGHRRGTDFVSLIGWSKSATMAA
jgi:hypothetical protein